MFCVVVVEMVCVCVLLVFESSSYCINYNKHHYQSDDHRDGRRPGPPRMPHSLIV